MGRHIILCVGGLVVFLFPCFESPPHACATSGIKMMNFLKILKFLELRYFLIGAVMSFGGLSIAGWLATEKNMFASFQRSHQSISVESLFYPTSRQLVALAKEKLDPAKISVVVAGSSVMRGNGQSEKELWSLYLQKELGETFQVLNLSVNGGGPGGQGLYMAEWLLNQGRKVIFVSDISIVGVGLSPDNGATYRGLFFDANSRGYLTEFPERTDLVNKSLRASDPASLTEHWIKASLNSYFNFNDLWTFVGYKYFSTVWTSLTIGDPWGPRKRFPDAEANCDGPSAYKNYYNEEMNIMRGFANAKPPGNDVDAAVAATIPPSMKPRSIFVVNRYSPFYYQKMNLEEQSGFNSNIEKAAAKYQSLGITTVPLAPPYGVEDFCDRAHFSPSGGQKLAASLAPFVKLKAKELSYE